MTTPPAPLPKSPPAPTAKATPLPSFEAEDSHGPISAGIKVCYWGPSGWGKTTAAMTWPGLVVLNWDPNRTTLANSPSPVPIIDCLKLGIKIFHTDILPMLETGRLQEWLGAQPRWTNYKARTVLLDSWTHYGDELLKSMEGQFRNAKGVEDTQAMWNAYRLRMNRTAMVFANLTLQGYHHIGTVHEATKTETVDGRERTVAIIPTVNGQFASTIWHYYDYVLSMSKSSVTESPGPGQPPQTMVKYSCWTVPPDPYRMAVKSVAANVRLKKLPNKITGHYPELCKLWGVEP